MSVRGLAEKAKALLLLLHEAGQRNPFISHAPKAHAWFTQHSRRTVTRSRGRASSNIDTGLSTGTKTTPTQPLTTTRNNIDIEATGKLERCKGWWVLVSYSESGRHCIRAVNWRKKLSKGSNDQMKPSTIRNTVKLDYDLDHCAARLRERLRKAFLTKNEKHCIRFGGHENANFFKVIVF